MKTQLMTSLDEIKSFNPCSEGWKDILKGQKKTKADSVLFPLVDCLNSNSIRDVCWLIGKRQIEIDICIKFAQKCVDSISHLNNVAARDAARFTDYVAAIAAYAAVAAVVADDDAIAAAVDAAAADAADAADAYAIVAYAAADAIAAANAADAAAAAADATQKVKNKQFMIDAINEF